MRGSCHHPTLLVRYLCAHRTPSSRPFQGNQTAATVEWPDGGKMASVTGKTVQLEVVLQECFPVVADSLAERQCGDSAELQTAAKDMVAKLGRVATQQTTRRARAPPKPSRTSRMKRPPRRTRGPPSTIALRRRRASGAP